MRKFLCSYIFLTLNIIFIFHVDAKHELGIPTEDQRKLKTSATKNNLDSVINKFSTENSLYVSAMYSSVTGHENANYYSLGFKEDFNYSSLRYFKNLIWVTRIHSELSYYYILDSLWFKNRDLFSISILGSEHTKKYFEHSYSFTFRTPLLNDFKYTTTNLNETKKAKVSGFLNPATAQISYGFVFRILSQSYFNFSLATIKVDAIPKFNTNEAGSDVLVGRDYKIMYGFSIDINYSSNSDKKMIWKNESHLFFNEFNHNGLCLTMNNKIEYRLLRNLVIRYDSGLRYEPLVYRGMRFIQEVELCLPLTFKTGK